MGREERNQMSEVTFIVPKDAQVLRKKRHFWQPMQKRDLEPPREIQRQNRLGTGPWSSRSCLGDLGQGLDRASVSAKWADQARTALKLPAFPLIDPSSRR